MVKNFIEDIIGVLFPNSSSEYVKLDLLLTNTLMIELRVIAVVAKRVDAIMLLRIV